MCIILNSLGKYKLEQNGVLYSKSTLSDSSFVLYGGPYQDPGLKIYAIFPTM